MLCNNSEVQSARLRISLILIGILAVTTLLCALIIVFGIKKYLKPMDNLKVFIKEKIVKNEGKHKNEVEEINYLVTELEDRFIATIKDSLSISEEVNESAGELKSTADVVLRATNEITHATEEVTEGSISKIINQVTADFRSCQGSVEKVQQSSNVTKEDITLVVESFVDINASIQRTNSCITGIKQAVAETENEVEMVVNDISNLSQIAEGGASTSQEINASIEELNALMNNVDASAVNLNHEADVLKEKLKEFNI